MAEPRTRRKSHLPARPPAADRRAFRLGRWFADAARALPGLPRHCRRPEPGIVLAALAGLAILARWPAVVSVGAAGVRFRRRRVLPIRAHLGRHAWAIPRPISWRIVCPSEAIRDRPVVGFRPGLCSPRACFQPLGLVPRRAVLVSALPAAALSRLFLCRRRRRRLWDRARFAGTGRMAGASLGSRRGRRDGLVRALARHGRPCDGG